MSKEHVIFANIAGFSQELSEAEILQFLCGRRGLRVASEIYFSHR